MSPETRRAGAALDSRTDGETQRDPSARPAEFEALTRQVVSLPPAKAKRLILHARLRGEISLEQAQALFDLRPALVTA